MRRREFPARKAVYTVGLRRVMKMDRRDWLRGLTALSLAGFGAAGWGQRPAKKGAVKGEDLQKNWKTLLPEGANVATSTEPLKLADAERKKRLAPPPHRVLRPGGTAP